MSLPNYELIPISWINEKLVKGKTQNINLTVSATSTLKSANYVMVIKHDERSCPGCGCPKHPLKTRLAVKMEEGSLRWGDFLT